MENRSIYALKCSVGPVKIGIAIFPKERCAELQIASPFPLRMDYCAQVHEGDAAKLERRAHEILDEHRLHGEWFDVESDEAVRAITQAAGELGIRLAVLGPNAPRETAILSLLMVA